MYPLPFCSRHRLVVQLLLGAALRCGVRSVCAVSVCCQRMCALSVCCQQQQQQQE
jgi:hypothetical protein